MDRQTALRALGLPPDASPNAVRRAFARLRRHLLDRALAARDPRDTAARLAELGALQSALPGELGGQRRGWRPATALAAGIGAVAAAWALGSSLAPLEPRPPEAVDPPPAVQTEGPAEAVPALPARLAVSAPVDGARFSLADAAGALLLSAPADGAEHVLDPAPGGPLALRVSHPDCGEGALETLELVPGERLERDLQPCPATGWLVVRSNVTRDQVHANDRSLGSTGPRLHPLPVGPYRVRVEKPGYAAWSDQTAIGPGEVVVLRATLRRQAAQAPVDRLDSEAARTAAGITQDKGGTRGWFESVSSWMVAHHDVDGTGLIDAESEVASISCNTWQALEISYDTGRLGAPMSRLYGFDGSRWVPGALGFDVRMRDEAYDRMRACGLR